MAWSRLPGNFVRRRDDKPPALALRPALHQANEAVMMAGLCALTAAGRRYRAVEGSSDDEMARPCRSLDVGVELAGTAGQVRLALSYLVLWGSAKV